MRKQRKRKINLRPLFFIFILIVFVLGFLFFLKSDSKNSETVFEPTKKATTTSVKPFQEDVDIKPAEGVVNIGKKGRITVIE